jgi:hypothetical protein
MANRLKTATIDTILTLKAQGWSAWRIAAGPRTAAEEQ